MTNITTPLYQTAEAGSARPLMVATPTSHNPEQLPVHILRLPEVLRRVGLCRASIYQHITEGSFPRPIPLGIRARGWIESEVSAWINARVQARGSSIKT